MSDEGLIQKTAVDKNNKKLGTIVKLEQKLGKTTKINVPHAIIRVRKFLKNDLLIPIEKSKIIKIVDKSVIFDLHKEDFDKEVKKQRLLREQQELYDGKSPLNYGAKVRSSLSPMAGKLPEVKSRKK
ncbi:MAG: hypothetical protein ACTSO7_07065 [Candidatus Heimdallarchaeota archaeon]